MHTKYFIPLGVFILIIFGITACSVKETSHNSQLSQKETSYAGGDELVLKTYPRGSLALKLLLPERCNLIDQPRLGTSLMSLTSDNGKGSTCIDNINIVVTDSVITDAILDEQIDESVATSNVQFGRLKGTWYEGKTSEGGSGYSFDFISNDPYHLWLSYMIYPRYGHESEFSQEIVSAKVKVQQMLTSLEITR